MPGAVPREKYPDMDWRAADKIAAWRQFKQWMQVIFMADQVPEDRWWALILVAGGDEAYNGWDTLEETTENVKEVEQVWQVFKKSFEQSSLFWHFRDAYLADVRQEASETTADLDLHIKQIVKGCKWLKETEEQRMIDLLYHATIYYEISKYIQESDPNVLKYKAIIEKAKSHERNCLEYKDHQASHGGANSAPSYNNWLQGHAMMRRHMGDLREQPQRITVLKQVAMQPQNQPRPVSVPPAGNMPLPQYPQRCPSNKGPMKQVQAENASAPHKNSSDSETRLNDIQEPPRRHKGLSRVKELAKFFTPSSDEGDQSCVNTRTRRKRLFNSQEKEEGKSEKK